VPSPSIATPLHFGTETSLPLALRNLLRRSVEIAGAAFSGTGVIVTDESVVLPTFPLRPDLSFDPELDPAVLLGSISVAGGKQHDGFHILASDLRVRALSLYFSPPITPDLTIDRSRPFGGRDLAALFGSMLEGVLATGIATTTLGIVTFAHGFETSRDTRL
jgi:hypothetical protein